MKTITTFDKKKNSTVIIGVLIGDTFNKIALPRHYMKMIGGWGIEKEPLEKMYKEGMKFIKIKSGSKVWKSKAEDWFGEHAMTKDFGHGEQVFLSQKWMVEDK